MSGSLLLLCAVAPLLQTGAYRRVDALPGKGRGVEKKKQQAEKRKLISQSFPFFSLHPPFIDRGYRLFRGMLSSTRALRVGGSGDFEKGRQTWPPSSTSSLSRASAFFFGERARPWVLFSVSCFFHSDLFILRIMSCKHPPPRSSSRNSFAFCLWIQRTTRGFAPREGT